MSQNDGVNGDNENEEGVVFNIVNRFVSFPHDKESPSILEIKNNTSKKVVFELMENDRLDFSHFSGYVSPKHHLNIELHPVLLPGILPNYGTISVKYIEIEDGTKAPQDWQQKEEVQRYSTDVIYVNAEFRVFPKPITINNDGQDCLIVENKTESRIAFQVINNTRGRLGFDILSGIIKKLCKVILKLDPVYTDNEISYTDSVTIYYKNAPFGLPVTDDYSMAKGVKVEIAYKRSVPL